MKARRTLSPKVVTLLVSLAAVAFSCITWFGLIALHGPQQWKPDFHYPERPTHFYTAREAYEIALPQIASWHSDAFIAYIQHGPSGVLWGLRADGKGPAWTFDVVSPSAMKYTIITLIDDVAFVSGLDGHPDRDYRDAESIPPPIPSDWLVDSDQALMIAREAGAQGVPQFVSTTSFRVGTYGLRTGERIPLSWLFAYGERLRAPFVIVDVYTGVIHQNDFAQ